jgi:hypothetical protein
MQAQGHSLSGVCVCVICGSHRGEDVVGLLGSDSKWILMQI